MNLFYRLKPELSGFNFFFINGIMEIIEILSKSKPRRKGKDFGPMAFFVFILIK